MPLAAAPARETDPSIHLVKKFFARKDELLAALGNPDFYIGLLVIGVALALALLTALLIQRRVKNYLLKHPPKLLDSSFLTKALSLLAPALASIYLILLKPFADEYAVAGDWTDATIQLCFAWLLAKCVLLVVRSRPVAWFIATVLMLVAVLRATGFIRSTVSYLNSISFDIGQVHLTLLHLMHGLVILVVVFWIAGLLSRTLENYLRRGSSLSYNARELTVKFFTVFVYFIALMITLSAVGVDVTAFAVFGGALGVGIGLGLQKLTSNFVSGITLLLEKSVQIGDLVEIGGNTGHVRQLNIRYALMETADGREIMIPNEELVSGRVTNWTHTSPTARVEIKVSVDYGSDALKARELMLEAAREHKLCMSDPPPTCWLREFGDNGIQFFLTFWIPDVQEGRNGPQSEVMFSILEKFRSGGVEIAVAKG